MGGFFRTLGYTNRRTKAKEKFCLDFSQKFGFSISNELVNCYRGCLLSIFAGSNNGSFEDCVRLLYRDLNTLKHSSELNKEQKLYFLNSLYQECFDGMNEKHGYWWARKIIDEYLHGI